MTDFKRETSLSVVRPYRMGVSSSRALDMNVKGHMDVTLFKTLLVELTYSN